MRPELVRLFAHVMPYAWAQVLTPTWFTMVGLAGIVTLAIMLRTARGAGIERGAVASAILWGYLAAVLAGIVVPASIDAVEQLVTTGRVRVRWAGMTSFWGYLAGFGAVAVVARRSGVSLARLFDLATPALGISLYLARLGCFIAGCDYGKVTSAPWAVRFPAGSPAWHDQVNAGLVPASRAESLPVHPTQLYEAFLGLAIAGLAVLMARRGWGKKHPGRIAMVSIGFYAVVRFGIETLRGDVGRGFFGPLSSGQVFSIGVLATLAVAALWTRRRGAVAVLAALPLGICVFDGDAHADDSDQSGSIDVGVLAGWSAPLNRRADQVAPVAGPSLSIGYHLPRPFSAWIDADSLANHDATHGTGLISLQFDQPVRQKWTISPRFGMGSTLVNFHEAAFRDVAGITMRVEANVELAINDHWILWVRPLSFDLLTASDLGGPIFAWQFRVGVAYQHRGHKRAAQPMQPQPMQPAPMPPPPPMTTPLPPPTTPTTTPPPPSEGPKDPYR